jgi:chaperonin cofactor prefoldin
MDSIKLYATNTLVLMLSFSNIENTLKIILLTESAETWEKKFKVLEKQHETLKKQFESYKLNHK